MNRTIIHDFESTLSGMTWNDAHHRADPFVAVDDNGNPVEVPPWTPVTMLDLQRQRQARVRIPMRKRIEGAMAAESYTAEGTAARSAVIYSDLAVNKMKAALETVDMNDIWTVHGARRHQSPKPRCTQPGCATDEI